MKKINRIISMALSLVAASAAFTVTVSADVTNYTYSYDWWYEYVQSPDAYSVTSYVMGVDLGISNFTDPQGLFVRDNRVYVCDSGNNRIVLLEYTAEKKYVVKKIYESVTIDGEESAFNYPMDLFETESGDIYIADTKNNRILKCDMDFNYVSSIVKPITESIAQTTEFLPAKLVVDKADRCYVQAININKGLLEFDGEGDFSGFVGANKVQVNPIDYIWKTYFSTTEQRAQMELFVPTEYNNVFLDNDGFIYTTTSTFNEGLIETADPVRRLNSMGVDILVRNGYFAPIGELDWGDAGGVSGSSRFVDVVAFDNESYCCLDRTRGRMFMYDFQGNLLYVFGGIGNKKGYFLYPTAIAQMDYSILVLDGKTGALTHFNLTEYGNYIKDAMNLYKTGKYEESANMWDEVLKRNGNYDLAYIGKGRAALRQGDYKLAMKYYEIKRDGEGYGKAFQLYRKQWMEENLVTIIIILVAAFVLFRVIRFILRLRKKRRS